MTETVCHYCSKRIPKTTARVALEGHWCCEDCAYLIEHPTAKRIEKAPKANPLRPQAEQLFGDAAGVH